MGIGDRFVDRDHAKYQLAQYWMGVDLGQQMIVAAYAGIHLGDEQTAHAQVGMPLAIADVVDLLDDAGQPDRLQIARFDRDNRVGRGKQAHFCHQ